MKEYKLKMRLPNGEIKSCWNCNGGIESTVYTSIEKAQERAIVILNRWEENKERYLSPKCDYPEVLKSKPEIVIVSREVSEWKIE